VEAFNLLQVLLSARHDASLPKLRSNLLYFNEKAIGLVFRFIVENRFGEFFVDYRVTLSPGRTKYQVIEEEVAYRENKEDTSFKSLISKNENGILIRNKKVEEMNEAERISVMVAKRMAVSNA
ncbi:hypothetical protein J4G37_54090, partial [Microvirga sp. 3-52]|nr:hypothetical protein [Microvirga sp. 3-52]